MEELPQRQGQAQGRLRAPLGPAGAISHEEQQPPWKHQSFPGVSPHPITTPWQRRRGQSTFVAQEGKHNPKMELLSLICH